MSNPNVPSVSELPSFPIPADNFSVSRTDWTALRKQIYDTIIPIEYGVMPPPVAVSAFPLHCQRRPGFLKNSWLLHFATPIPLQLTLELFIPGDGDAPRPVIVCGDGCWQHARDHLSQVLNRGYALALFNRLELAADEIDDARWDRFSHGLYHACPGTDCGALAAWAWGYHRVIDFLVTRPEIDCSRISLTGHSRGGKTVLLAAATDERIALVNPNGSGCGGTSSFYYCPPGGETLRDVLDHFPYWFAPGFDRFLHEQLTFDQHFMTALIAPRWLLSTEAADDHWANLPGQELIYAATAEVYRLLAVPDRLARHVRPGPHSHRGEDFTALLDFADCAFGRSMFAVE